MNLPWYYLKMQAKILGIRNLEELISKPPKEDGGKEMRISRWQRRMALGGSYGGRSATAVPSETAEQIQVVNWVKMNFPECLFTSSCGGMRTSIGVARKMKAMGYRKGTPDLMIFEPRQNYHGLFIEMKRMKGGVTSPDQKVWLAEATARGYKAVVARGYEEAVREISSYLTEEERK